MNLDNINHPYSEKGLSKKETLPSPFDQFDLWFKDATQADIIEPNAMTLSTVDTKGQPSSRTVLLKSYNDEGLVFFTNYESLKAQQMDQNPKVALLFAWLPLNRQVRIEGKVQKTSTTESEAYFKTRPRGSQIGAWASQQSQTIESREELQKKFKNLEKEYEGKNIPLPPFWGGYRVIPEKFEFWQGRRNRLHDRILYKRTGQNWEQFRLCP